MIQSQRSLRDMGLRRIKIPTARPTKTAESNASRNNVPRFMGLLAVGTARLDLIADVVEK